MQDVARLKIAHAILDAECCCDGDNGVIDFDRQMARAHIAAWGRRGTASGKRR